MLVEDGVLIVAFPAAVSPSMGKAKVRPSGNDESIHCDSGNPVFSAPSLYHPLYARLLFNPVLI